MPVFERPVSPTPAPDSLWRRIVARVLHSVGLQTAEETKAATDKLSADLLRMIEDDKKQKAADAAEKTTAEHAQRTAEAAQAAASDAFKEELAKQQKAVGASIAAIQAVVLKTAQPKAASLPKSAGPAAKPVLSQPPLPKSKATISGTPVDSTSTRQEAIQEQEKARPRGRHI